VSGGTSTVQSSAVPIPQGGLVTSDPSRYGTLSHPGDLYSYDILTQAGVAVRGDGKGVEPLDGLDVKRLIAVGESQSAGRLTTYVNAVHPIADVYNGFLIYSRGATPAPLGDRPASGTDPTIPDGTRIRGDLDVPVFTFETEYDVDVLGFADARQPDSHNFRAWELAGGSHQDAYAGGGSALTDLGDGSAEAKLLDPAQATNGLLSCAEPINAGSQYAPLQAVLSHLDTWVRNGTAPPKFPRIETTGSGDAIEIGRDQLGIAKGGVRTPIVRAPLAANVGDATNTPDFCRVFGHNRPFDAPTLAKLYPSGSADYVKAFDKAVNQAVKAGVWLKPEAENFRAAAEQISFG
jgi:Alpha/beta hydrolase domain